MHNQVDSSHKSLERLLLRQNKPLPFDKTVSRGKRKGRFTATAYVWHQTLELSSSLVRRPFSRATYRRYLEPWGLVELLPGAIYRSAEPRSLHFGHLNKLVKRTLPTERTIAYALANNLSIARIDLGADGQIAPQAVQRALDITLQPELWPVLLCCDGGHHRAGIVTAALRRAQGWPLDRALDEYERLAAPTPRVSDGAAIGAYFAFCQDLELREWSRSAEVAAYTVGNKQSKRRVIVNLPTLRIVATNTPLPAG
jgi:hypothetical protein